MGRRRPKGTYEWFVVKDADGDPKLWKEGYEKLYWAGPYDPTKFYEYQSCGHKFEFGTEAETQALLLTAKQPDLLGKVRVELEWVAVNPFIEQERKNKRRRELRAARKACQKAASDGSSAPSVPPERT